MLKKYQDILLVNLDKLTYAGNLENLKGVEGDSRRVFVQGDICDKELVSTDEVYEALGAEGYFMETTPINPHSPYSSSKASADHFVKAFHDTYGMPINITRCSNNYGPYQFPEKLIPLMINNVKHHKQLPVYGDGMQIRDWLYVEDHCKAIDMVCNDGKVGEIYNVGGQ